jgi:hypothetical protein
MACRVKPGKDALDERPIMAPRQNARISGVGTVGRYVTMRFRIRFCRKQHMSRKPLPSHDAIAPVPDEARWAAVVERDSRFDGRFVYSVATTGVYCRPSCPARPKRENVRFHATWAEAEAVGFRPCKRCRPKREPSLRDSGKSRREAAPAVPVGGAASLTIEQRVAMADWDAIGATLDAEGCAVMTNLLDADECGAIAGLYPDDSRFRSHIHMERYGYGRGEYKYFACPLPDIVSILRTALYPALATAANRWNEALGDPVRFPPCHAGFLKRCHDAGQTRPTPLLLRYGAGDYNCLHQDLYGEHVFPLQATILLSEPEQDFAGGEFVLTEQRPRMQSRAMVIPLKRGDAVVFAVRHRPVQGARRSYRVNLRHGVSTVRSGNRYTLGVIFHDAR